ncbi:hypothetical protein [Brucella abortus]|uniref:hypothetical protein n=1 Tax=Brucella abortus TaxID=235 RepID=UPI0008D9A186|nr:hypothetical protein [Brucella abortus]MBI1661455.1 hypothetical protein [Brucella abortus]MBI1666585.1 hypothetical protein [Brucella abortus]OHX91177.1 hypothetical protein BFJ60_12865 [Brucella abortus]OHX92602.1 hypothetical protein BFJ61_13210 [Brucella abortus]
MAVLMELVETFRLFTNYNKLGYARRDGCRRFGLHIADHFASHRTGNHTFQHKETGLVAMNAAPELVGRRQAVRLFEG